MHQLRNVGEYQVLRVLASFSQSFSYKVKSYNQVFLLTAVPLSMPVSPTSNQLQLLQRLLKKCQKYKQMNHPNVQKIHDVFYFQENSQYFFAIVGEYSTDKDLQDLIQEDNTANLQQMKQVMIDLCSALEYLQKKSIIHSNINPENIRKIGQNYKITFPTFKEIRWFNSQSDNTSQNKVSAADYYISPELKGGIIYSSSTDVWSMGIVFFQLLSGRQFKFDSTKLPSQMGNFTEMMLSNVPNAMMRSMLREMLNIDNKARINIGRVKNIIMNTDISQINTDIQEEIIENNQFHILTLPIFLTQVTKQPEKNDKKVKGEINYIEMEIDGFSITIVYKPNDRSLDFCIYKNEKDYSFHIEYTLQNLPNNFLSIFNNTQQIFEQIKQQRLKIAAINLFGEIIFSLEDGRYQILKIVRQQQQLKQNFKVFQNNNSKNQMQNQDNLLWYMKQDKGKMSYDDRINKNILQKQKFLNELLKSDRNFDNLQNIMSVSDTIFDLYYYQQNFDRCMQLNETILPYYSQYPTHIYVGKIVGRLIACSELLNDNQLTLKWRQILHSKYAEQTIVSYLYTSLRLYDAWQLYLQNGRILQSNSILMKLRQYTFVIASELDNHIHFGDLAIVRLLPLLTSIFAYYRVELYQVGCQILTKIYNQLKSSAIPSNKTTARTIIDFVKQKIKISASKAPVLYSILTNWLKANNPEQYAKLPKNIGFSDYDYPY